MNSQTGLPLGFEFVDIEIINHKNENDIDDRWNCDHCSLFFLSKDKLELHQKVHSFVEDTVHCKYCNKVLTGEESKECYSNKKCETCEYRCSQCPQRFLRQSSLLNHEKNHLTVKKRRSRNITFHTKQADEVDAQANNSSKKRKALKNNPEESLIETDSLQPIISPKKKSKVESDGFSPEKSKASTFVNISSRRSSRKILPDKSLTSPDKSKLNESVNKVQVVAMTDGSAKENSVNYKPFSCHVCGETFASDNGLLEHIKTHGDNAAETFKCKYCGDKFDDIYKMQYHLAICPHAEDELESSLVKNLTPKTTPMKPSIETPSSSVNGSNPPRKRGRPFKIRNVIPPQTEPENSDNNTSASHRTRSRITKQTVVNVDPSPNTQAKLARKPRRSIKGVSDFSEDCDDGVNESLGVSAKRLDESGSDDESRRKIHQCPHPSCGLKFTREKAMLCHYRNHEDSDGTVKCYKCGIPFDDDRELTTHIKECKSIKEENDSEDFEPVDEYDKKPYGKVRGGYMCKICGKTYITNDRLKRHKCPDGNPLSKKFPCRLCDEELKSVRLLKNHFTVHHPQEPVFLCQLCDEVFNDNAKKFVDHFIKHKVKAYECAVCLSDLKSFIALMAHYRMCHPKQDRTTCLTCGRKYNNTSALSKHRHVHTGRRPYACPLCKDTFNLRSSQLVHIRRHFNDRPYKCKICPKSFFNIGDLIKHNRSHTGERPYSCHVCEATFSAKSDLNHHRVKHEYPYKCMECSQLFPHQVMLNDHMTSHRSDQPFMCPVCFHCFFHLGALHKHIARHHIKKFNSAIGCEICGVIKLKTMDMIHHLTSHRTDHVNSNSDSMAESSSVTKKKTIASQTNTKNKKTNIFKKTTVSLIASPAPRNKKKPRKVEHEARTENYSSPDSTPEKRNYIKRESNFEQENSPIDIIPHDTDRDPLKIEPSSPEYNSNYDENAAHSQIIRVKDENVDIIDVHNPLAQSGIQEVPLYKPSTESNLACVICYESFSNAEDLLNHVLIHI